MATDKPRFSISVSDDVYGFVNDYQHKRKFATQTKAIIELIEAGIQSVTGPVPEIESDTEDMTAAKLKINYDELNDDGRKLLLEMSDTMVESGKYKKTPAIEVSKTGRRVYRSKVAAKGNANAGMTEIDAEKVKEAYMEAKEISERSSIFVCYFFVALQCFYVV